ncbi:hypothetical protein C1645_741878 [Glomus cerebriforme]|uniref:Uncharacterized protein n=1 Tax=Glomus cerebriforme TaxID=658196 RepID=A0A397SJE0_9GLOM|nr:hypothetical protein C1645_741878 [Glomus cerebriforme]
MDESVDKRFRGTIQSEESNIYSVRPPRETGGTTPLSANSNNNHMGRSSPPLDDSRNENGVFRGNGASRPEKISYQNANYLGRQNDNDGYEYAGSSSNSECNDNSGKSNVRGISSQRSTNRNDNTQYAVHEQQINGNVEGEKYTDITMVPFECCPNQERIQSLQLSLGQLRRVGVLAGNAWTKETAKTPCRLVVPNVQSEKATIPETMLHVPKGEKQDESRESCNNPKNPLMIVEVIANKSDRKRVAKSLKHDIEDGNPSKYICYMEDVKRYGFDHIIIIGNRYAGILFLDCYGRVFEWEDMMSVLWPIGDWNKVKNGSQMRHLIWGLEFDGTVVEFRDDKDESATKLIDVHPVAKKKKKSKKKQKKQH